VTTTKRSLTGAAGEYHVAAELSKRDWLATVTIKNAPGTDVLAKHSESGWVISVQTKTASQGSNFRLNQKDEAFTDAKNEWYALVALKGDLERPDFYLVPRNVVATILFVSHREWLSNPGRGGRARRDNPIRGIYARDVSRYRERWDLLERSTTAVGFRIPAWFRETAARHKPTDLGKYKHPWWRT
jgi:hypothetical protein